MTTDPSWLYSTIAQSSAAIVAIIGGFITASVLMLTAEKRNLANQLNEKKIRMEKVKYDRDNRDLTRSFAEELQLVDDRDINLLEGEINDLEARLRKFSYPPNLGWGLGVLGFLAVVGILFPVFLIWTELYSDIARKIIVYCFYASILGLFAYIASQIYSLRSLRR